MAAAVAVLCALVAVGWFYASPYVVIERVRRAADRGDVETVNAHVDFPALRQSVKEALRTHLDGRNPLARLGITLSPGMGDVIVDTLVTPENVRQMMQGRAPRPGRVARRSGAGDGERDASGERAPRDADAHLHYESWDRFAVDFRNERRPQDQLTLVWARDGLSWTLIGIRVPPPR